MDQETYFNKLLKTLPDKVDEIMALSKNQEFISENEIKTTITNFFDDVKTKLEEEEKNFIETVISNLPEGQLHLKMKDEIENNQLSTQDKIKSLMGNLEAMIEVASVNEEIINHIKSCTVDKLLRINQKDNKFEFRPLTIQKVKLYGCGKSQSDATWDNELATRNSRATVLEEGKVLNMTSSSCWNFFATKESFKEGIVKFTISVDIATADDHFYVGLVNTTKDIKASSGCLCCSNPNSWYYDRSGNISSNGTQNSGKINTAGRKKFTAQIEADFDAKTVKFTEEKEESTTFPLVGDAFRFLVGSCNTCNAKVTILDYEV
jgi:hypothetical protein